LQQEDVHIVVIQAKKIMFVGVVVVVVSQKEKLLNPVLFCINIYIT